MKQIFKYLTMCVTTLCLTVASASACEMYLTVHNETHHTISGVVTQNASVMQGSFGSFSLLPGGTTAPGAHYSGGHSSSGSTSWTVFINDSNQYALIPPHNLVCQNHPASSPAQLYIYAQRNKVCSNANPSGCMAIWNNPIPKQPNYSHVEVHVYYGGSNPSIFAVKMFLNPYTTSWSNSNTFPSPSGNATLSAPVILTDKGYANRYPPIGLMLRATGTNSDNPIALLNSSKVGGLDFIPLFTVNGAYVFASFSSDVSLSDTPFATVPNISQPVQYGSYLVENLDTYNVQPIYIYAITTLNHVSPVFNQNCEVNGVPISQTLNDGPTVGLGCWQNEGSDAFFNFVVQ